MKPAKDSPRDSLTAALDAIDNLLARELEEIHQRGLMIGHAAHGEIEHAPINQKRIIFYRHFVPLRRNLVSLLALNYRRCFKLALAHPRQTGGDPHAWTSVQLQPAISAAWEWIRDWYILACEGENQCVQKLGTMPFVPGEQVSLDIQLIGVSPPSPESWRAPAWLFGLSVAFFGVGQLKTEHIPAQDSEERLGASHTRLLLKGGRRLFLWELIAALETVTNEEIANAGAIPTAAPVEDRQRSDKKRHLKGLEGLGPKKTDMSQYMHNLTEKQQLAISLKFEHELTLAEIASRMEVDRKTAYEHIDAAKRKIDHVRLREQARRANRADDLR